MISMAQRFESHLYGCEDVSELVEACMPLRKPLVLYFGKTVYITIYVSSLYKCSGERTVSQNPSRFDFSD